MPEAIFSSKFLSIWEYCLIQSLRKLITPSNYIFCSNLLIPFQNVLMALVASKQGFLLMMSNNFLKVSATENESNNKPFYFLSIYLTVKYFFVVG